MKTKIPQQLVDDLKLINMGGWGWNTKEKELNQFNWISNTFIKKHPEHKKILECMKKI